MCRAESNTLIFTREKTRKLKKKKNRWKLKREAIGQMSAPILEGGSLLRTVNKMSKTEDKASGMRTWWLPHRPCINSPGVNSLWMLEVRPVGTSGGPQVEGLRTLPWWFRQGRINKKPLPCKEHSYHPVYPKGSRGRGPCLLTLHSSLKATGKQSLIVWWSCHLRTH